jgi:hypothetical protein
VLHIDVGVLNPLIYDKKSENSVGVARCRHRFLTPLHLYNRFVTKLRVSGLQVKIGQFGAMMQVSIENDSPVTLLLEKEAI